VLITRTGVLAGLVAGAIALTACGSDNNKSSGSTTSAGGSSSSSNIACGTGSLKAEGSSAQANAMSQWIKDYQGKCSGATVNYSSTGSGAGVKQFTGGQVDFGGSDAALDPTKGEVDAAAKRCGSPALNLPMVVGPVGVAFKLNGVKDLTLTPDVTAKIFLGKITKWNDPAIAAINSGAKLPSTDIKVFFRSDDSGTTQNFERYLSAAAPSVYTDKPSKKWTGSVGSGKKGNEGVQAGLQAAEGGIAYLELSFIQNGGLDAAKIDNGGGPVELSADTASKALTAAKVVGTNGDLSMKLDYATKTPGAYPIVLVTYEMVCSKYSDAAKAAAVKAFLTYTAADGQKTLKDIGYAPLPAEIQTQVQASVATIS
jgi:phosphate transport system substrate-binding protein